MSKRAVIVGGGYVGFPLAMLAAEAGFDTVVLDTDQEKVRVINGCQLKLTATTSPATAYSKAAIVVICVPTPLRKTRTPDISYVLNAMATLIEHKDLLCEPFLVSLESTVYPGFTREVLVPKLHNAGFVAGKDVFVAFSPERVDPGNDRWYTKNTPKIVGGFTDACALEANAFYRKIVDRIVSVESTDVAEMVKLLENTFRAVNIALVNEMAIMCNRLGVDVWEVIDAASTKPFGFMPFYPGPGVGGHCIPIDPHYLSWKMQTIQYHAQFVELAGRINSSMPHYVLTRLTQELNRRSTPLAGAHILVVGVAYKPNVSDVRESPALDFIELLYEEGAVVHYFDPHVRELQTSWTTLSSESPNTCLERFDAAVVMTNHKKVSAYELVQRCPLVFDTRNATRGLEPPDGAALVRL